jgi:hypothetical protein
VAWCVVANVSEELKKIVNTVQYDSICRYLLTLCFCLSEHVDLMPLEEGELTRHITNFVIIVSEHVDPMPSEDGQLTETCKGNTYRQIESHWTVLIIILLFNLLV